MRLIGFEKSHLENKKYNAILDDNGTIKKIPFGSRYHQHFKDTTGLNLYSHLDHNDELRKKRYFARHKKNYPKFSADYFSKRYLWT